MKSVVAEWRRYEDRYRLLGSVCLSCKENYYPRTTFCSRCGSTSVTERLFNRTGTVYSYTTIHASPKEFQKRVPYVVALIKLDDGPIVTSEVVDVGNNELKVGTSVYAVFRKVCGEGDDVLAYAIKFRIQNKKSAC